MTKNAILISRY